MSEHRLRRALKAAYGDLRHERTLDTASGLYRRAFLMEHLDVLLEEAVTHDGALAVVGLRIADLAAHCGYGMRRFHQLFVDAFGETPHRYLQRLRLDAAVILLADGRYPLVDIAGMVGFADQSTFTHAFTKRFGVAPGRWRGERH